MAKKIPPPLSILHRPVAKGPTVIHGRVQDEDKTYVKSTYARDVANVPKVVVKNGKLVGGSPPVSPRGARQREINAEQKCFCGCGRTVYPGALFARGHVRKLHAALGCIERGELDPDEALTPQLVELLGPWVPRGKGHTPTNSLWDDK